MPDTTSLLQYKIFKPYKNLLAFTTTKQTFPNKAARFTGDHNFAFAENRRKLASILDIQKEQLVFPRQTHTNCVAEIFEAPKSELQETDALVTNKKGICLCVQTADCVPVLLFDPEKNVIAAVHAGWRGTVSKIVEEAIRKMENNFGTSAENIIAAVGPSISPEVYEVGEEVIKAAKNIIPNPDKTIIGKNDGKFHFNLWEANRQIMLKLGMKPENIEISSECSFKNSDKYFSARRNGINTGRMVSGIMLR